MTAAEAARDQAVTRHEDYCRHFSEAVEAFRVELALVEPEKLREVIPLDYCTRHCPVAEIRNHLGKRA